MKGSILALLLAVVVAASPAAGGQQQTPNRGGTVVFGPINGPPCLNLLDPACGFASPQLFWITDNVIPGAFRAAPDFTWRPTLVSGATFSRRPPFTVTYRIRSEARWSDGVPVTARDFVFTHRAILAHLAEDPDADVHRLVRSIRAVDAKTVRVVLRSRDARWRQLLFFVVLPRHALAGESLQRIWFDRIHNPKTGRPIGSGPFLVEAWEEGKQLTLVRNPRYWGPHTAYVDRLVLRLCKACNGPAPEDVLKDVRGGDVDIALARETGIVPELRRVPGTSVVTFPSNGWEHLDLRLSSGGHPALRN
jgi:peptide/nickel transport system substrate-binding protein